MSTSEGTASTAGALPNVTINPPKEFMCVPGEPPIPWAQWKEYFLNYITVDFGNHFAPQRKKRLLLHSLGPEGLRIYNSLPKETSGDNNIFDQTIIALDQYFSP